jgi:hypothetical protein
MSEEKKEWAIAMGLLIAVIALINIVPGTLFMAYACKVVWNMFSSGIYPEISTLHAIGPMLVLQLVVSKNVDCVKPERGTIDKLGHAFGLVVRPYFLGGWFILCAWILSCFVN